MAGTSTLGNPDLWLYPLQYLVLVTDLRIYFSFVFGAVTIASTCSILSYHAYRYTDKMYCIYWKPENVSQTDRIIYSQALHKFRTSQSGFENVVSSPV